MRAFYDSDMNIIGTVKGVIDLTQEYINECINKKEYLGTLYDSLDLINNLSVYDNDTLVFCEVDARGCYAVYKLIKEEK